jgi:uncharacterized damage-inducible protein DinB
MTTDDFDLGDCVLMLSRTPAILRAWLTELPAGWVRIHEGPETWSPFDVVGHLIHGEKTDWIPRVERILSRGSEPFEPFDRFAQFKENEGRGLDELLDEFEELRRRNLRRLQSLRIDGEELAREGTHPEFGTVTMRQLLATWVTHDLAHIGQIARVMAKRHAEEVGPWRRYLSILSR